MRFSRILTGAIGGGLLLLISLLSGPAGFGPEPQSAEAVLLSEVKKLLASDAELGDQFGWSVAVDGDTAVVGARLEDAGGVFSAGAVYVFGRNQGGADNWGEVKKLTASDAQASDVFGWSVALDGDTAVVGARGEDAGGATAGAAYVFVRNEGSADNWGQVKKLTASDAQELDSFGWSVAVDGDTAVVGAFKEDAGGNDAGAAYVFQRNQGGTDNWGQVKKLTASDAQAGDLFGDSVAVDGDTAVVGAKGEDAGGSAAGAAYVFGRDQGGADNWGEVKKLTASDAEAGDMFGQSAAVDGDTAVVGANEEDAGGGSAGAAYVFGRNEGGASNWGEVKKLTASDAELGDQFGFSVAVDGDTAVVGARLEDAGGNKAGAAYLFGRNEGGAANWGQVKKLTASDAEADDEFGVSVAVDGGTAVVGAYFEDAGGSKAGAAYVFDPDADGDGVPDVLDNCPNTANAGQEDAVHPGGPGDACDDPDSDGVFDDVDNCPDTANPGQENTVHPATPAGDHCEDADGDLILDVNDACPDDSDNDSDGDGVCNGSGFQSPKTAGDDNCPSTSNPGQENAVHPGTPAGDHCEDPDSDGVFDITDNCPDTSNPGQEDAVHPGGPGDHCEDPDTDGVFDISDNCPDTANPGQVDAVHPGGLGDHCDDPDTDGVFDITDNCPDTPNPGQENADGDPYGDACETADCIAVATAWVTPPGDDDCDSFTTTVEAFVGTDPNDGCANTDTANDEADDKWPTDMNDNQRTNTLDVAFYVGNLNAFAPGPPYTVRLDLTLNGIVNTLDIAKYVPLLNEVCTALP